MKVRPRKTHTYALYDVSTKHFCNIVVKPKQKWRASVIGDIAVLSRKGVTLKITANDFEKWEIASDDE